MRKERISTPSSHAFGHNQDKAEAIDVQVVPKRNPSGHVDDVLRSIPEMRQELGRSSRGEPDEVLDDDEIQNERGEVEQGPV